jgi:hypothetical protein
VLSARVASTARLNNGVSTCVGVKRSRSVLCPRHVMHPDFGGSTPSAARRHSIIRCHPCRCLCRDWYTELRLAKSTLGVRHSFTLFIPKYGEMESCKSKIWRRGQCPATEVPNFTGLRSSPTTRVTRCHSLSTSTLGSLHAVMTTHLILLRMIGRD